MHAFHSWSSWWNHMNQRYNEWNNYMHHDLTKQQVFRRSGSEVCNFTLAFSQKHGDQSKRGMQWQHWNRAKQRTSCVARKRWGRQWQSIGTDWSWRRKENRPKESLREREISPSLVCRNRALLHSSLAAQLEVTGWRMIGGDVYGGWGWWLILADSREESKRKELLLVMNTVALLPLWIRTLYRHPRCVLVSPLYHPPWPTQMGLTWLKNQ